MTWTESGVVVTLKLLLRVIGGSALLALIFVVTPESWMIRIHAELGLGVLPGASIVGYPLRSTPVSCSVVGGLLWIVSSDLVRHRPVIRYLSVTTVPLGVALLSMDWLEGWTLSARILFPAFEMASWFVRSA